VNPTLRRATARVSKQAAPLILDAVSSLEVALGDRGTTLRALEACYLAERTEFAHRFGLLAEVDGQLAGLVVAYPGRFHGAFKLGTGVVLARSAGARHVNELTKRGRVLNRLLPSVDRGLLYVSCLAVAPRLRRQGIGRALMERAIAGAERLGLGIALDTGMNDPARLLYEDLGFRVVSARETTESERELVPVSGMLRMERPRSR
jgi:ribosomal protein S18 acetylase RimI-like enzyme